MELVEIQKQDYVKKNKKNNLLYYMNKKYVNCCRSTKKHKKCKRKDNKIFSLPRKYSRKKCKKIKGFTMRASCAPYKFC